ncbi:lysophospholipid acyltransferase family protein [Flavobacterium sp. CS20]|uniref:lysophospholipid acyltransferase family protein n=1 Tax=Flavobacterium sp. CS20 TaxID=2775246 RepID=UPI001B3A7571|nr:lysophospholipid acyltransferase family protein [Flavobacterium sp. CS20]QTY27050.1 lysophospholipid acyltransferase family protein [Flavobacterium sp. CS20]
MFKVIYTILYILFKSISLLPFRVIYIISDLFYLITFYGIGYRKRVVLENLKLAFPDYDPSHRKRIAKDFYKHFCDIFLEMIKLLSISESEVLKRFKIKNPDIIKTIEAENKSIIFLYAHYASFEYSAAFTLYKPDFKGYGVYKRIRNKAVDQLMKKIRSRFGVEMIDKNDVPKIMMKNQANHQKAIYGMIADQSPKADNIKHWTTFLGVETPVFVGAEVLAKRLDLSVCYMKIEKSKRGFYDVELIPITTKANKLNNYEITDIYFKHLEQQILKKPAYYFWSHKRWKHKRHNFK